MHVAEPIAPITLSQLCGQITDCLNQQFGTFTIALRAEISSLKISKGHCYITLIETSAKTGVVIAEMRAQIWAREYARIRKEFEQQTGIELGHGLKLLFYGQLNYSEKYGLSFNISEIDSGYTLGQIEIEKTKNLLFIRENGYQQLNPSLPKPAIMRRIAVISAANADGFSDLCLKLKQNQFGYYFSITLFEAALQGINAVSSLIAALNSIKSESTKYDCLVIVRGGGDAIHLHCFNDLDLSLEIAHFPIRVITGIGHSTDMHLADYVASKYCATPTDVAFYLVEQMYLLENQILKIAGSLVDAAKNRIENEKKNSTYLGTKLSVAKSELFIAQTQSIQKIGFSIYQLIKKQLEKQFLDLSELQSQIKQLPDKAIKQSEQELQNARIRLPIFAKIIIEKELSDSTHLAHLIHIFGIEQTLARGYSLIQKSRQSIHSNTNLQPADYIQIVLSQQTINAQIVPSS